MKKQSERILVEANNKMFIALKEAIIRIEIANSEGDPILSAWLPKAKDAINQSEPIK